MTVTQQSDELIENLVSKMLEMTTSLYCQTAGQIFERVKRKSAIRPVHNFGILRRELFICTPRCHKGVLTGHTVSQFFVLSLFMSKINICKLCPSV
jgi:uncharacterized membrane protein